ncbi:hypothetical protein PVAND_009768 [Polypedilum vanderplanki]|uniref:Uncharacterized protein n=1 Tax=Polypedilum vanderplanki TaxID=319348 RepID=A0A9J6CF47_POLVA|nr:hypothetical protein PVAND_009768 [Polypedilum vanderplanki]
MVVLKNFQFIAFATGYDFTFPFLSVDSGISVYDKCVQPLYKQCINANRPSMAIIGRKNLPSREEMLQDIQKILKLEILQKIFIKHITWDLRNMDCILDDLAKTSGIEPLKQVLVDLSTHQVQHAFENSKTFRFYNYKVFE